MATAANPSSPVAFDWSFEVNSPMGGAAGEAYTNTLASSGMPPAAVLAREAIQNSVDAKADENKKVRVEFVAKDLSGPEKSSFVLAAGLSSIAHRAAELGLSEPNCLTAIDNDSVSLSLLYINDYQTTGLKGDPDDADSKFYRFLLSLGDGGKEHDEHGTGGSYGFGKSVYSSNSSILTIFAYSRTVDGSGAPMSLLFGCGYFKKHKHENVHHTGRAWFGEDRTPTYPHAQQIIVPLRDGAADEYAELLGFEPRDAHELGTSVLIVGSTVSTQGIREGVEDWWWPRLISNLLDVRVISEDGTSDPPRPRKRDDLRPFIEAFDIALGKAPAKPKVELRKLFNKMDGLAIGSTGLKVLDRLEDDTYVVDENRQDSVALIRSPLMVVAYHRQWQMGNPVVVGVYVATEDVDDVLRAAEPPAHDRWDPDARRLRDESGQKKLIVTRILVSIRRTLKTFQSAASPPPSPRPRRLSMLERSLAAYLSPSKRGTRSGPDARSAPISLVYDHVPSAAAVGDGSSLRLSATFSVRLKRDAEVDSLRVRVRATCPVLEDGQEGDLLPVAIEPDVAPVMSDPDSGWLEFELDEEESVRFTCVSDAYDPSWTVKFVPEVEPVSEAQ